MGEPPPQIGAHFERAGNLVAEHGRGLRFGVRIHVVARPTAEEAWRAAEALLADADPAAIKAVQDSLQNSGATGQRRMAQLHGGTSDDLEIYPNVWAGVGLLRGGAGTALVGSYDEVADRMGEYVNTGVDEFINDVLIHYVVSGEGPVVVLLHGWTSTWYQWKRHVMPALAERFTVIAPDMRGVGDSEKAVEEAGYEKRNMAEDIYQLVRALGHENVRVSWAASSGISPGTRLRRRSSKRSAPAGSGPIFATSSSSSPLTPARSPKRTSTSTRGTLQRDHGQGGDGADGDTRRRRGDPRLRSLGHRRAAPICDRAAAGVLRSGQRRAP